MLPANLVDFVHGPVFFALGTRSATLRTAVARIMGAIADGPADSISFFLPRVQEQPHLDNIAANGLVALAAGNGLTSQAYQFKGRVIDVRPSTPGDEAIRDLYRDKLIAFIKPMGMPETMVGGYIVAPSMTITFRVAKIFNQTPGPGAGRPVEYAPAGG